jgi:two-component system NtrC family sensor kinase
VNDDHVLIEMHFARVSAVEADESQLEQVFLDLINNARQAMLPGGGTLTLSTEAVDGSVRVAVADTGPGVPAEIADRIFEPFFSTREVGAGAGLGLAIVYGIVSEHGGRVWVERSPSGGAQFVVELPRTSSDSTRVRD